MQSSDLSAFNEGLWDCGKHDSICLFHFKAVSVHFRLRFSQAVSPSLVAVLTRFLQIRCSRQHQSQQKHSLSSYLHKKGCCLWWKTTQMKGEYYCSCSSRLDSLLCTDSGKQLYQEKDLDTCLQLIKRPSLNRGKFSMCLHAFVCDMLRKTTAVTGTEVGNEGHLALWSDFFFYLITLSVKSGLFGSLWQNPRQVGGISISSTILLLNLAKQIKNPFFPFQNIFSLMKKELIFEICLSYVQFWSFLYFVFLLSSCSFHSMAFSIL